MTEDASLRANVRVIAGTVEEIISVLGRLVGDVHDLQVAVDAIDTRTERIVAHLGIESEPKDDQDDDDPVEPPEWCR